MRTILVILGLIVVLAAGLWWWHRPTHPAPVDASIYETDMVEGLVRQILTEFQPNAPSVCFLAFGEGATPPSHEFIERFAGSQPPVRSCASAASPPINQYFEYSTGRPGLEVHIIRFKEIVTGSFDVLVAFSNLPAGHNQFTYRVSNSLGSWQVKSRNPA